MQLNSSADDQTDDQADDQTRCVDQTEANASREGSPKESYAKIQSQSSRDRKIDRKTFRKNG